MKKRFLFFYIFTLIGFSNVDSVCATMVYTFMQSKMPTTLVLWFADGTNASIQLYTKPLITFEGDRVHIVSPIAEFDYSAYDIIRFSYEGDETSIKSVGSNKQYQYKDGKMIFDSSINPSDIKVYSEDGKQVAISVSISEGKPTLSLTEAPKGVYVISIKGNSFKILKK